MTQPDHRQVITTQSSMAGEFWRHIVENNPKTPKLGWWPDVAGGWPNLFVEQHSFKHITPVEPRCQFWRHIVENNPKTSKLGWWPARGDANLIVKQHNVQPITPVEARCQFWHNIVENNPETTRIMTWHGRGRTQPVRGAAQCPTYYSSRSTMSVLI